MANIQDLRAKHNPQFSYMFEVSVAGSNFSSSGITAFAKTVSIPQVSVEQMIINHKAGKTHYAAKDASAHTVNLTFWDDESGTVYKFFNEWFELIQNPEDSSGIQRGSYIADTIIKLKDATDKTETASIVLSGSFPMEISDVQLSYDSSEAMEVNITLSFEKKTVTYNETA